MLRVVETSEAQEEASCGEDDSDLEEARFEDDTESFTLREREFKFTGLPPGTLSNRCAEREGEVESPGAEGRDGDALRFLAVTLTVGKKKTYVAEMEISVLVKGIHPSIHQSTKNGHAGLLCCSPPGTILQSSLFGQGGACSRGAVRAGFERSWQRLQC